MKKILKFALLSFVLPVMMIVGCTPRASSSSSSSSSSSVNLIPISEWQFNVGNDTTTAQSPTAGQYTPTFVVNLKIVGGGDTVLYNGTVSLKSDTMYASEFLKAAVTEKSLAQAGIDVGFVTTIGDYVNNSENSIYWMYTVNGDSPDFGCNQLQLRNNDYMLWTYRVVNWSTPEVPAEKITGEWAFTVGTDYVTTESASATQYSPTYTINLKIIGGGDTVLFNGTVTLKSDTMLGSEFLKAAVTDKALAQAGIDAGFVTTIGSYVNNSQESIYWMYKLNGATPSWGINNYQMRDGDYMIWTYEHVTW